MTCPKCGGKATFGYGLAGGGIGAYEMCLEDGCDWFSKTQDQDAAHRPTPESGKDGEG